MSTARARSGRFDPDRASSSTKRFDRDARPSYPTRRNTLRAVSRRSSALDVPLDWLEAGWQHDETLVLLHGLMTNNMAYRFVIDALADRYHVVVPDLPGHGRDRTYRGAASAPTISHAVDWLGHLLEALGRDSARMHLLAHSLGGTIGFEFARTQPGALHSLVLVAPGFDVPIPSWSAPLLSRMPPKVAKLGMNRAGLRLMERVQWRVARMDKREASFFLEPLQDRERLRFMFGMLGDLARYEAMLHGDSAQRVLLMWGRQDRLLNERCAKPMAHAINAELSLIEHCGHSPMEDQPEAFLEVLLDFLDRS